MELKIVGIGPLADEAIGSCDDGWQWRRSNLEILITQKHR